MTARVGDDVTMECDVEAGQPAPERVWRRNGVPLTTGGRCGKGGALLDQAPGLSRLMFELDPVSHPR